ncbi:MULTISPECIES: hypothetical protein [Bacillus]|uniref:Uncharacterized protein n=1 Tax=Bacillus cereus TaxID=1396 RepID=A0A9X0MDX2_BACCE|nr:MULTISPECIES: hypothetical protein [Bacillus cereus group]AMR88404.1 hypothetical protein A3L20_30825 [Bacillus thuringiensis]KXY33059.1 hypothetical protein AT268_16990 [Bacillus cereus]MBG9637266.1 hypothetical protein [Bacillus thuringiensis]MBG9670560.1 hypothetical protein [Bacillus thuringiensis]MDR5022400.1 hypothetical protein [Bacillus thuringiensis]
MKSTYKYHISTVFPQWRCNHIIVKENEKMAKYHFYKQIKQQGFINTPFEQFEPFITCEYKGVVDIATLFGKEEPFRKMCNFRRISFAKRGMRVEVQGRTGTIVGNCKNDLFVVLDDNPHKFRFNPHWEIVYFNNDGEIIKDYRKGAYAL